MVMLYLMVCVELGQTFIKVCVRVAVSGHNQELGLKYAKYIPDKNTFFKAYGLAFNAVT